MISFLFSNWHCALPCCKPGFHQLSLCASRPHTCSPLCSDWMSRKAMSSYWLKIASRAGAKNRRVYKPWRLSEASCTYAAVAGKVEALREIERGSGRERLRKGGGSFSLGPVSRRSLSQDRQKMARCRVFQPAWLWVLPAGGGG